MYEYLFYLNIYLLNKKGDNRRPPSDYETVRLHHLQIDICKLIQNKNWIDQLSWDLYRFTKNLRDTLTHYNVDHSKKNLLHLNIG